MIRRAEGRRHKVPMTAVAARSDLSADVLIVGGGMAGATLALAPRNMEDLLAEQGHRHLP
jgi:glycerol-3-phosphate dehydrogenase